MQLRVNSNLAALLALSLAACAVGEPVEDTVLFATEADLPAVEDASVELLFAPGQAASLKAVDGLRVLRSTIDEEGIAHTRVQQMVGSVPVWHGEAIVHLFDDGEVFAVTDSLIERVAVDTNPVVSADEAADLAVGDLLGGWDRLTEDPTTDLWVFRTDDGVDHLAWRVQLRRVDGAAHPTMPVGFLDAHTGELLWSYENLQTATCDGATNFYGTVSVECYTDGTSFFTEDQTKKVGTFSYANTTTSLYYVSSASSTFDTSAEIDRNAFEAHYVSGKVVDYFLAAHGRNGIDGTGGPADVTTHGVGYLSSYTSYATNYVNAYWDGASMTYGDGDGVNSGSLTVLDVGGHEFTHGVTQYEANLTYSGEPGHLNEATSDIFGAMVERAELGESSNTWLMGEDTWTPGTSGDALRYMNDPAKDGVSRDYWTSGIGSVDVHYGSGVPNLAFYLMAKGGTHPRGKSTVAVTGIGADAAAKIWYLALASYMTASTNFSAARTAMISASTSLYGATAAETQAVYNAWAAVGVGSAYSTGGGGSSCTSTTYTGSISRSGRSAYAPSSSGSSVGAVAQTVSLTGPSSANFDLYLEKKSGRSWSTVASGTGSSSTESLSYTGTAATYRARVYSTSGSGSYTVTWCY